VFPAAGRKHNSGPALCADAGTSVLGSGEDGFYAGVFALQAEHGRVYPIVGRGDFDAL